MSDKEVTSQPTQESVTMDIADHERGEKHLEGEDVGLEALTGTVANIHLDSPEAKKVLRKIDLHLLPLLCFTYLIQVKHHI